MKVTFVRAKVETVCPECQLTGMAVFHVQIDFADYASPLSGCAACLSNLGNAIAHEARVINKAVV